MKAYLLDVNVLVTLHLPASSAFERVDQWFSRLGSKKFATCAITQAGFVRVLTQQSIYTQDPVQLSEARILLRAFLQDSAHQFWPMDTGYLEATAHFEGRAYSHKQVTDSYLLGLAIQHQSTLATLDQAILHLAGSEFAKHVELIQ